MRLISSILLLFLIGCNSSTETKEPEKKDSTSVDTVQPKPALEKDMTNNVKSTYDDTAFATRVTEHMAKLKNLHDKKVFKQIHEALLEKMDNEHKTFFGTHSSLEMLAAVKGSLFSAEDKDVVFVVYDSKAGCFSFLVYNNKEQSYNDLYRDLPIQNGLADADCKYFSFGTLDYQLAEEIIMQTDPLINKPLAYLEFEPIKITVIENDETFLMEQGCISKAFVKGRNAICVSTSMTYNNWECLQYSDEEKMFTIVYGQAFAD